MKNIIYKIILLVILCKSTICSAQQINWRSFTSNQKHIANVNLGWDYSLVMGMCYGYKFKTKMPIVANLEYSFPFGKNIIDDFKTKFGGQIEFVNVKGISVSAKAYGIFRRYKNELARFINFGSEFSTNFGYYHSKWYVAGEVGFDKAITTQIKHSDIMKSIYPNIKDGWYIPTGGNFFYGIIGGLSFKNNDLYLKIGKIITQDFKISPIVPFYMQLGFNKRFKML